MDAAFIILFFIVLGIAALRWGVDSREGLDSPEWERRALYWSGQLNPLKQL